MTNRLAVERSRLGPALHGAPSLAWRLGGGFALAFVLVAALVAALQLVLTDRFSGFVTRLSMQGQTHDIEDGLLFGPGGQVLGVRLDGIDAHGFDAFYANLKFRVLNARGQVVASSEARRDSLLPDVPVAAQGGYFSQRQIDGRAFHVAAFERVVQGQPLVLQLGRSDRFAELAREAIAPAVGETIGLFTVLAVLVSGAVAWVVVRGTLRPIHAAVRAAGAVGPRNLGQRLPLAGLPREITPLVLAFNGVLAQLEAAFAAQQRFFTDAAHELKTPLALLRTQLEQAGSCDLRDTSAMLRDVDTMARSVQQLLQLAELDAGQSLRLQAQPLAPVLDGVVRWLAINADRAQVALVFVQPALPVVQVADAGALAMLVKNLLDNAIAHTPPGGEVQLLLGPHGLVVQDSGPGVPEVDRDAVFGRFWRAPGQQRAGAGLGLAIVHDIAKAHGWRVHCAAAALGGARFEVAFDGSAHAAWP